MAVNNTITHYISSAGDAPSTRLNLRQEVYPLSGQVEDLFRQLKQAFTGKGGKAYGRFSREFGEHPLAQWLDEFIAEKMSFTSFTQKAMSHLQGCIEQFAVPIDGHILFFTESLADCELFYIFIVDHCEGLYIDSNLDMADALYLDTGKVSFGVKANLTAWKDDPEDDYLSIMRFRGDKQLNEALWHFIGFTDEADISADTAEFLEIVDAYSDEVPEEEVQAYRTKIVDYCLDQDKSGEKVSIDELSRHIDESAPTQFAQFVAQKQDNLKTEIIPDRTQLRQFIRISGRNEQLSISFSSDCLGDSIIYDQNTDSLTLTNIPQSLKVRMLKHLQRQTEES